MNQKIALSAHTIISGSTGSGKSVLMNNFLSSLIKLPPYQWRLWICDPKRVDYIDYKPICEQYATEPEQIDRLLQKAVDFMESRYREMQRNHWKECPYYHVFIICDEFGQILRSPKAVSALDQLLRLGRAARVHVIAANQNAARTNGCPSFLRVNFTCQIGLHCVDKIASRQATGFTGCELLPLYGYAYCMTPQDTKPVLYQIDKKSDEEIRQAITNALRTMGKIR